MINKIVEIANEAGNIILDGVNKEKDVNYKGSIDLVTEYDLKTEIFIKDKLSKIFPNHKIIGEETSTNPFDDFNNAIFIDPIDGTTNFVHGFPFVSISIGVYTDRIGHYGVVYNPVMNELFYAENGKGAFLNNKKISVSNKDRLSKSLCATGFPYIKDELSYLMDILKKVLSVSRGIRRAGSAALDLCYVAKGVFDLYYERNLKPWDISAGMIILKEAGGLVTDFEGKEQNLKTGSLIASNGLVHNEFLELIK